MKNPQKSKNSSNTANKHKNSIHIFSTPFPSKEVQHLSKESFIYTLNLFLKTHLNTKVHSAFLGISEQIWRLKIPQKRFNFQKKRNHTKPSYKKRSKNGETKKHTRSPRCVVA